MTEYIMRSEADTAEFGKNLADELEAGDVLGLIGDLGTGKTTLTKYIAEGLGITETITSPTFTIVNEYHSGRLPLFHFDAYRLEAAGDAFEVGMEEYFDRGGVSIIEWADMVAEVLPEDAKLIIMEYGEEEGERIYKCTF
jgi:tRNA threonylcarbamoyladenosine biosynthesis protein TsaE